MIANALLLSEPEYSHSEELLALDGMDSVLEMDKDWQRFLSTDQHGAVDPRDSDLVQLIRKGVPSICRGYLWKHMAACSGSDMDQQPVFSNN